MSLVKIPLCYSDELTVSVKRRPNPWVEKLKAAQAAPEPVKESNWPAILGQLAFLVMCVASIGILARAGYLFYYAPKPTVKLAPSAKDIQKLKSAIGTLNPADFTIPEESP